MKADSNAPAAPAAKGGDKVRIHYVCRLEDGAVFATTRNKAPIEFTIGTTKIIPGLQDAVVGMRPGETRSVSIPPEKAYGPYHPEMTAELARELVPADVKLEVGVALRVKHADGHESDAFVTGIEEDRVSVDGNHPLAGKNLLLEIELLDVVAE
mgnify:FL=1